MLVTAPGASSETVATDPEGDASHRTLAGDIDDGPASADLVSLDIADAGDALLWTVMSAAGAEEPGLDEVDTTVAFRHGARAYLVVAGEAIGLWITDAAGTQQRFVAELAGSRDGGTLMFRLPKDAVLDEAGAPLSTGALLDAIVVTTRARDEVQGPDPEQGFFCCTAWWTVHDRMPDEGGAGYRLGDPENATGLRLWSEAPLRASNGGGDRIAYTVQASNRGQAATELELAVEDIPTGWNVSVPAGVLDLPAGGVQAFPVVVETPSGHRHGGTETFTVRTTGAPSARVQLGIHYLDVPQPAGHHPQLFFHSQALEGGVIEQAGYAAGRLWMNTAPDDPLDDEVPIDSTESSFGGQTARWSICLAEGLRLGLDLTDAVGRLDVTLSAGRPYGDVQVEGAVYRYGPGPVATCDAASYRAERNETLVASIPTTDAADGGLRFVAPVHAEADRVAHDEGAALVLDLVATFTVPDSQAPGPLVVEPGGSITLPLEEFRDAPDVRVPSWDATTPAPDAAPPGSGPAPDAEAPAGWLGAVAVAAAAWLRRR